MTAPQHSNRFLRFLFSIMGPAQTGPYGPPVPPPPPRPRDAKGRLIKEPKRPKA